MTYRSVVVTGHALNTPLGSDLEQVCKAWRAGESRFSAIDSNLKSKLIKFAGMCASVDLSILHDRKLQKSVTRKDLFGIVSALHAAKHAGIAKGTINPDRFGMFVGAASTQVGDLTPYNDHIRDCINENHMDAKRFGRELMGQVNPMVMLQTLMNNVLCHTAVGLDIRGVNANYVDFQISGMRALSEAFHAVRENRADVVLAGGVAAKPEPYHADQGVAMGYLKASHDQEFDPNAAVRPYDAKRSGTILSEGSAFLVLEEEQHAIQRGATILARIEPGPFFSDARFAFVDANPSKAIERSLKAMFDKPNCALGNLSFIMGHANGSTTGDRVEALAYKRVFQNRIRDIALHSSKACFGEMTEAAPIVNVILAIEALRTRNLPASKNFDYGDDITADLNVLREPMELSDDGFALVTARSFSGIAQCLAVRLP